MSKSKQRHRAREEKTVYRGRNGSTEQTTHEHTITSDDGNIISRQETTVELIQGRIPTSESTLGQCQYCQEFSAVILECAVCQNALCRLCSRSEEGLEVCGPCQILIFRHRKRSILRRLLLDPFIEQVS